MAFDILSRQNEFTYDKTKSIKRSKEVGGLWPWVPFMLHVYTSIIFDNMSDTMESHPEQSGQLMIFKRVKITTY